MFIFRDGFCSMICILPALTNLVRRARLVSGSGQRAASGPWQQPWTAASPPHPTERAFGSTQSETTQPPHQTAYGLMKGKKGGRNIGMRISRSACREVALAMARQDDDDDSGDESNKDGGGRAGRRCGDPGILRRSCGLNNGAGRGAEPEKDRRTVPERVHRAGAERSD